MKCKHNFVRSGYGNDLICKKCGYAAMQGQLAIPVQSNLTQPSAQPIIREGVEVPICTGDKTVRISVYKDEFEKELKRSMGLDIAYNIMQASMKNGG